MEIHLIWAQDKNGGIGANGKLPWHVSEDLQNFKKITINSHVIMGRKTWDSLPIKPLPKRKNIVLSSQKQTNVETFDSYKKCLKKLRNQSIGKIFIIGGRSIYELFFNDADYLHITNIHIEGLGINEYFPKPMSDIRNLFKKKLEISLSENATYTMWINNNLRKN